MKVIDAGSVADWVQAVGTVGALLYVARQFRLDRGRIRALEKKDEDATSKAADEQARRIFAECFSPKGATANKGSVVITNYSDAPIKHVSVSLPRDDQGTQNGDMVVVPVAKVLGPMSQVVLDLEEVLDRDAGRELPANWAGELDLDFDNAWCEPMRIDHRFKRLPVPNPKLPELTDEQWASVAAVVDQGRVRWLSGNNGPG